MLGNDLSELCLDEKVEETIRVLSAVSRQPIVGLSKTPPRYDGKVADVIPFELRFSLGDEYHVRVWQNIERDEKLNRFKYYPNYGYELKDKDGKVIGSKEFIRAQSFTPQEMRSDPSAIEEEMMGIMRHSMGGIDTETPFMDFERYSVGGLETDMGESYFDSVYLRMMCHMKERGFEMPPILSKDGAVKEAMYKGDVDTVREMLDLKLAEVERSYHEGCLVHAKEEAKAILELANTKRMQRDKTVPLIEKFSYMDHITIPGGNGNQKYNILVVEDFGSTPRDHQGTLERLSQKVASELAKKGNYGGTNVFGTVNLPECIELCETGQIHAILMDGGHFSLGLAQQELESIGCSIDVSHPNTGLNTLRSGYDEKKAWKGMIYDVIEAAGHETPPCTIIPHNILDTKVGDFVHQMIGQEDRLGPIKDKLSEKHREQMCKAWDVGIRAEQAAGGSEYRPDERYDIASQMELQNMHFEYEMRYAQDAAKIGNDLSKTDFFIALEALMEQHTGFMPNFEVMKPTDIVEMFHALEIALRAHPKYADDPGLKRVLEHSLARGLSFAANSIDDVGFYKMSGREMRAFTNLVANSYIMIDNLKNQPHTSKYFDDIRIPSPRLSRGRVSVHDLVEREMMWPIIHMAEWSMKGDAKFSNPMTRFLLGYGRRIAKLAGCQEQFDDRYKEEFGIERLHKEKES